MATPITYIPSSKEEEEFLANYDASKYPLFSYAADIVILTIRNGELCVLLIERGGYPYKGCWALPGGFVNPNEDAHEAAWRELKEETGLDVDRAWLEELRTYSAPGRDPRPGVRVVSTAHIAIIPNSASPVAGDDAAKARFFPVKDIFEPVEEQDRIKLAFDHEQILRDGLERAAAKLEYTPLATTFLDQPFTLADLRRVYEIFWGVSLHAANFRRKVLSTPGFLTPLGSKGASQFEGGRSAELYTAGTATLLHPAILRTGLDGGIHDRDTEDGGFVPVQTED